MRRGKDRMKIPWKFLEDHAIDIINFENIENKTINRWKIESCERQKVYYICKKVMLRSSKHLKELIKEEYKLNQILTIVS